MIKKTLRLIICLIICQGAAGLGAIFTTPEIHGWYSQLVKPSFTPPNWLFAPVWTMIFTMMAISLFLLWNSSCAKGKPTALVIFIAQLILNVAWSVVFFGGHLLLSGFFVIIALWLTIMLTIQRFKYVSVLAAWLLVPYLCWVTFAGVLNFYFWQMNS